MPRARVHAAARRGGLQPLEQELALVGEGLAEGGDLVPPRRKPREFPLGGRRLAEPRSVGMESREPLPAALGRRPAFRCTTVEDRLPGRGSRHLLFQQDTPRGEVRERSRNRELRVRAEASVAYGLHGRQDVRAVVVEYLRDGAVPSVGRPHGQLERTALAMPLQGPQMHFARRAPPPLRAGEALDLAADLWVLEHGDETGRRGLNVLCSGAERHATSTVRLTPAAKSSSSSVASSRKKLPKCRDRARCGPHQASHSSA